MSTDLLKSFGAELLAALPQGRPATDELAAPTAKSGGSAMRSASEELEVARTLRDAGDLAGAEAAVDDMLAGGVKPSAVANWDCVRSGPHNPLQETV